MRSFIPVHVQNYSRLVRQSLGKQVLVRYTSATQNMVASLIERIKQLFIPPVFEGSEEKTRRASVLSFGVNIILFASPLIIIGNLIGGKIPPSVSAINLLVIVASLILRHLLHRGRVLSASIVFMSIGFTLNTLGVIGLGTIRTPTTATYLFFIVMAVILFDYKGIIVSISVCSITILGLIMAENSGVLPPPNLSVTVTQWVSYTVLFTLTAAISNEANRMMKSALHKAENENAERKRVETELRRVNDLLILQLEANNSLQLELREQALRDPLTGLYNRRYLRETLEQEVTKAKRDQTPLSVIISDIDHFKLINDSYGHQVGDQFLVEIAKLMKTHARSTDFVCRYGGEEFLIVMPGTPANAAIKRAEEILQKCTDTIIVHEGKNLQVAMSLGVATYPDHGQEFEEIIIKADKALYISKQNGRNRITLSNVENKIG
ncbi:MAG: GGDEF domain-containing protein [Anaerolineales bacterium]